MKTGTRKEIAARIAEIPLSGYPWNAKQLIDAIEAALNAERERAAKIADERAAFNRRLAQAHKIGDPIADLKHTRADEAEIIAAEIRGTNAD